MRIRTAPWRPGLRMSVAVVIAIPALLALGVWQLDRAAEKRALESAHLAQVGALPRVPEADFEAQRFSPVKLSGRYNDRYFLIDNQISKGEVGYWVVALFEHVDGRTFLVNRGWVAAGSDRASWPAIAIPSGNLNVVGVVWPSTGLLPVLQDEVWPERWPKRVQRMNVERMAGVAGAVAAEIRLDDGQPGSLRAASQNIDFSPNQHYGYALQWLLLAVVALVGYIAFGFRRRTTKKSTIKQ